jgi:uncharacterized Zn finger protein
MKCKCNNENTEEMIIHLSGPHYNLKCTRCGSYITFICKELAHRLRIKIEINKTKPLF